MLPTPQLPMEMLTMLMPPPWCIPGASLVLALGSAARNGYKPQRNAATPMSGLDPEEFYKVIKYARDSTN